MWNCIKALTNYKIINLLLSDDAKLPDVLNQFFACFNSEKRYASCTAAEKKDLHRVVKVAQRIVGMELPNLNTIYVSQLRKKESSVTRETTQTGHSLFEPLPSSKWFRTIRSCTSRLRNSQSQPASITPLPAQPQNRLQEL
eukprot:superscaffoldBa00003896_g17913